MEKHRKPMPLHTKVLLALLAGALLGGASQIIWGADNPAVLYIAKNIAQPLGKIYLNMILMVVIPLLFAAMTLGISEIGKHHQMGKVGFRFVGISLLFNAIAITLSIAAINFIGPGAGISPGDREAMVKVLEPASSTGAPKPASASSISEWVDNIIPLNPVAAASNAATGGLLGFVFFCFIFGFALSKVDQEKAAPVRALLEGIYAVCLKIIEIGMKLAPIGVFGLMFSVSALMGATAFLALSKFVLAVLGVLAIIFLVVCPLVLKVIAKRNPWTFLKQSREVLMTAFATCSSSAAIPLALQTAETEMKLPRDITTFVLTMGSSINRSGSTVFQTIVVLFLAQFYGISVPLADQVGIAILTYVFSLGVTGIPGGCWTPIAFAIAKLGLPVEAIGICLGVDRILDMTRTTVSSYTGLVTSASITTLIGHDQNAIAEATEKVGPLPEASFG